MKDLIWQKSIQCQECDKLITWNTDDDTFSGVVTKLIYHINNDTNCVRNRKIKELLGEKEKLAQDFWIKKPVVSDRKIKQLGI